MPRTRRARPFPKNRQERRAKYNRGATWKVSSVRCDLCGTGIYRAVYNTKWRMMQCPSCLQYGLRPLAPLIELGATGRILCLAVLEMKVVGK